MALVVGGVRIIVYFVLLYRGTRMWPEEFFLELNFLRGLYMISFYRYYMKVLLKKNIL